MYKIYYKNFTIKYKNCLCKNGTITGNMEDRGVLFKAEKRT